MFDTTLRDGAQTNGVDFTLADKLAIARMLDELGVDYVEGGYPGANPTDTSFFAEKRPMRGKFTAFGMTRRPGRSASNDPGLVALLDAKPTPSASSRSPGTITFASRSRPPEEENLASIRDSVRAAKAKGREVLLDCEHFFDGYKAKPAYALACAQAAYEEGARWVVLCDTNGGTLPHEVERIVGEVCKKIPGDHVGIHAHNDTEQAVANSFAAVRAGARQIQGTLNGLGERCGNANLVSIIPTLKLKKEYADQFEIGVSDDALARLSRTSHSLDELLNRSRRSSRALCRRERLCHQGRHSCLRHRQGARDLRTRRAGKRRQQKKAAGLRPGRPFQRARRARAHRAVDRQERYARHAASRRGQGARGDRLCL